MASWCHVVLQKPVPVLSGPSGFNKLNLNCFYDSLIFFNGRVEEAYRSVQKGQKALLDEWKNSSNSTLKWIADSSARVQAQDKTAPDLDHARAQRQEIEVRKKNCTKQ